MPKEIEPDFDDYVLDEDGESEEVFGAQYYKFLLLLLAEYPLELKRPTFYTNWFN